MKEHKCVGCGDTIQGGELPMPYENGYVCDSCFDRLCEEQDALGWDSPIYPKD